MLGVTVEALFVHISTRHYTLAVAVGGLRLLFLSRLPRLLCLCPLATLKFLSLFCLHCLGSFLLLRQTGTFLIVLLEMPPRKVFCDCHSFCHLLGLSLLCRFHLLAWQFC